MANKVIKGTAKADKITLKESNIDIYASTGNDSITLSKGNKNNIRGEAGNDTMVIASGAGTGNKL